jgi:hypothetical protein
VGMHVIVTQDGEFPVQRPNASRMGDERWT